jgi:hypothetical protein
MMERGIAGLVRARRHRRVSRNFGAELVQITSIRGIDDSARASREPEPPRDMTPQHVGDFPVFVILGKREE